jgi:hypothetical protein
MMPTTRYRSLLDAAAAVVGLPAWMVEHELYSPGEWLEGLILVESAGNPRAIRYERHQDVASPGDGDKPGEDDGLLEDDCSYGLMQVMGYNARVVCGVPLGSPMNFGFMLLPVINLAFGLRILSAELQTTRLHVPSALARYNGGSWRNPPGGEELRNQAYVDKVAAAAHSVRLSRAVR